MERSFGLILPCHNAQAWLESALLELIEVLPDLTHDFQIVVVDDGSTDATSEVAYDLELRFPQIRIATQRTHRGRSAAWQLGMRQTAAEIVLLASQGWMLDASDVVGLWRKMDEFDAVLARPDEHDLVNAGSALMIRRGLVERFRGTSDDPAVWLEEATQRGIRWCVSDVRGSRHMRVDGRQVDMLRHGARQESTPAEGLSEAATAALMSRRRRRPNYFSKLRAFALGE